MRGDVAVGALLGHQEGQLAGVIACGEQRVLGARHGRNHLHVKHIGQLSNQTNLAQRIQVKGVSNSG